MDVDDVVDFEARDRAGEAIGDDSASEFDRQIAQLLLNRRDARQIYTFCGDILLAVRADPTQEDETIKSLYGPEVADAYRLGCPASLASATTTTTTAPHLYGLCKRVLVSLLTTNTDQSIILGGESNTGKTFTLSQIIYFFSTVLAPSSSVKLGPTSFRAPQPLHTSDDQRQLVGILLRAFGNARTAQNNDSSRFCSYTTLTIDKTQHRLIGLQNSICLLERSRAASRAGEDSNFHVLESLAEWLANLNPGDSHLGNLFAEDCDPDLRILLSGQVGFAITASGPRRPLPREMDWSNIHRCLNVLFGASYAKMVLRVLLGILALGNFNTSSPRDHAQLRLVAQLWRIDVSSLSDIIFKQDTGVLSSAEQAGVAKKAVITQVYEDLFLGVVQRANALFEGPVAPGPTPVDSVGQIRIVDIYGSESFSRNTLQQLLINSTNETFLAMFLAEVVAGASSRPLRSMSSGTAAMPKAFLDETGLTAPVHRLRELWALYNSCHRSSNTSKAEDDIVVSWNASASVQDKRLDLQQPRSSSTTSITVFHSIDPVQYEIRGSVGENIDRTPCSYVGMTSTSSMLAQVLVTSAPARRTRVTTLTDKQQRQVADLMAVLKPTEKHFVRCMTAATARHAAGPGPGDAIARLTGQIRAFAIRQATSLMRQTWGMRRNARSMVRRYGILLKDDLFAALSCGDIETITDSQVRSAWEAISRIASIAPEQWTFESTDTSLHLYIHPDTVAQLESATQKAQQQVISMAPSGDKHPHTDPDDNMSESSVSDGSAVTVHAHANTSMLDIFDPDSSYEIAADLAADAEDQTYFGPKLSSSPAALCAPSPNDQASQQRVEDLSREVETLRFKVSDAEARAATTEQVRALETIRSIESQILDHLTDLPSGSERTNPAWLSEWFVKTLPKLLTNTDTKARNTGQQEPSTDRTHQLELELERSQSSAQLTRRRNRELQSKLNNLQISSEAVSAELRAKSMAYDEVKGRLSATQDRLNSVEALNRTIANERDELAVESSQRYHASQEAMAQLEAMQRREVDIREKISTVMDQFVVCLMTRHPPGTGDMSPKAFAGISTSLGLGMRMHEMAFARLKVNPYSRIVSLWLCALLHFSKPRPPSSSSSTSPLSSRYAEHTQAHSFTRFFGRNSAKMTEMLRRSYSQIAARSSADGAAGPELTDDKLACWNEWFEPIRQAVLEYELPIIYLESIMASGLAELDHVDPTARDLIRSRGIGIGEVSQVPAVHTEQKLA